MTDAGFALSSGKAEKNPLNPACPACPVKSSFYLTGIGGTIVLGQLDLTKKLGIKNRSKVTYKFTSPPQAI